MTSKGDPLGLAQLMDSEEYSDLKLVCQGLEFKVHKAILSTQSPVFAAVFFRVKVNRTSSGIDPN